MKRETPRSNIKRIEPDADKSAISPLRSLSWYMKKHEDLHTIIMNQTGLAACIITT
jgi:hypothetical protein